MGPKERKNIKVERKTFDRLKEDKEPMQTWDQYFIGLIEGAPIKADVVQVEEEQVRELVRDELRAATDDIITRTAEKTAEQVEDRLQ